MDFKKFIIENHPDPDSVFEIDNYNFEQIVVLAENFAKEQVEQFSPIAVSHRRELLVDFWMNIKGLNHNRGLAEMKADEYLKSTNCG